MSLGDTSSPKGRIVFFRAPTRPSDSCDAARTDPYEAAFSEIGYEATSIPVLQEEFHTAALERLIASHLGWGDATFRKETSEWAGVVISSKRGAEGWTRAVKGVIVSREEEMTQVHPKSWNTIPLYTVGSSSLDYLTSAQASFPTYLQLDLSVPVTAKSASALVPLFPKLEEGKRYLVVRGDKSVNGLQEAGLQMEEVEVYSTTPRIGLSQDLHELQASESNLNDEASGWLVFFAPSSAGMVIPHLEQQGGRGRWSLAAIGETTASFLAEQGWAVDAVAAEPGVEGLLEAIKAKETR